jgi:hypothetical protein
VGGSTHTVSIHIIDNDSLLNVFYLYRLSLFVEDFDTLDDIARIFRGTGEWGHGRWWYKPAQVCQRWRNIILGSASYLGISLVSMIGTPVGDMMAHSPPLPLVIDYFEKYREIAAKDEEGAVLALKKRDRVRCMCLRLPSRSLQKLIEPIVDEEYPILEYLLVHAEDYSSILMFPETLQAPHLRHLALCGFDLPIGSRLLTSAVGLVALVLMVTTPDTYIYPDSLLHWLSFMPQLETLIIYFPFPISNDDMESQIAHIPIMAPLALPNLHRFSFRGLDNYLEEFIHQIITPRLEKLDIDFIPSQLTFSAPRLQQFINTAENLKFDGAKFKFSSEGVYVSAYHRREAEPEMPALSISVDCWHIDLQVSSAARLFNLLSQMIPAVGHFALEHEVHLLWSKEHNQVDPTEWRELLKSFRNVKILYIDNEIVGGLSRCLDVDDGELPCELLPELQELTYSGGGNTGDAFTSFIDARQNAGCPITLVRRSPSPDSN